MSSIVIKTYLLETGLIILQIFILNFSTAKFGKKIKLRRISYSLKDRINLLDTVKLEDLLAVCFENDHVIKRKVKINWKAFIQDTKVALWLGKQRVNVSQKADSWSAQIAGYRESNIPPIRADGVKREISVHISGLFSLSFKLD